MDYKKLKAHRTVLLDIYKSLGENLKKEGDEFNSTLKAMQENIAEEKFLLAIVGEVKAGKSTFINALLGEAILPYDALQATSEIIEIYKSEKKEVRVTFANGKTQVVEDDLKTPENELVPFLKRLAAVKDEYRAIPIVQVNRFLTKHYSEAAEKAVFRDEELDVFIDGLDAFIDDSNLKNPEGLDAEDFASKIREYIAKHITCAEIPKNISLGYPHTISELSHFRLVDTPGINAIGGIEQQTKDFLFSADAVVYLQRAGQQESSTLRNALQNVLPEKVQERLILVLTYRSPSFNDAERILEATYNYYPKLGSDNIFCVDSRIELYLREEDIYKKSMEEISAICEKDTNFMDLMATCFMQAKGDRSKFFDLVEDKANFDPIRKRIQKDAQSSAFIQMQAFASAIQDEYEVLDNRINDRLAHLKMKYQDPQSFALEIQKQIKETRSMIIDYNEFTSEIREKFSPRVMNSRYYQEIEQIVNSFIDEINAKAFDSSEHNEKNILSYLDKFYRDLDDTMTNFVDSLKAKFKKRIANKNVEMQSDYSITVPIISLGSIWDTALNATKREINEQLDGVEESKSFFYYLGNLFFGLPYLIKEEKKEEIRKSLPQQAWKKMQPPIVNQLVTNRTRLEENIDQLINNFCKHYQSKFNGELLERKRYMKKLENEKKTNEELKKEISTLETQKKTIEDNIKMCIKIKGEL